MMETNTQSDSHSPGTDAGIETKPTDTDRLNAATKTLPPILVGNATEQDNQPRLFDSDVDGSDDAFDGEYRAYAPLVDANQFLTVAKQ